MAEAEVQARSPNPRQASGCNRARGFSLGRVEELVPLHRSSLGDSGLGCAEARPKWPCRRSTRRSGDESELPRYETLLRPVPGTQPVQRVAPGSQMDRHALVPIRAVGFPPAGGEGRFRSIAMGIPEEGAARGRRHFALSVTQVGFRFPLCASGEGLPWTNHHPSRRSYAGRPAHRSNGHRGSAQMVITPPRPPRKRGGLLSSGSIKPARHAPSFPTATVGFRCPPGCSPPPRTGAGEARGGKGGGRGHPARR